VKASGLSIGLSQESREIAPLMTRNTGVQQNLLLQFRKKKEENTEVLLLAVKNLPIIFSSSKHCR
jgi:hypothetical protein